MRKAMLLLAVFGLAGSLWAADPIIGTWKLNLTKSKFGPNQSGNPQAVLQIYRQITNDQIEFTITGAIADNPSVVFKLQWPAQGGAVKVLGERGRPTESYVETLIEPGNWYVTVLQDGTQVGVLHKIISKDGKTMTQTFKEAEGPVKRINRVAGEDNASTVVFDKQ